MIGGASQADVGILVISARKGEYEAGFEKGGQSREHAVLAKTAGVNKLVVVINKMDDPTVNWSQYVAHSPTAIYAPGCLSNKQTMHHATANGAGLISERYKECTTKLATFLKGTGFNLKNDVFFMPIGMFGWKGCLASGYG